MCGFIAFQEREAPNRAYVSRRGPTSASSVQMHGFTFEHFLLHVTGSLFTQPIVEDNMVCLFNGEIYNQAFEQSDGEVILPMYKEHGENFVRLLDGEFAIAIYDFNAGKALFYTDAFGTKPLWVNGLSAASYQSCIGGHEVPPNTMLVRTFAGEEYYEPIYHFDFSNQHKDSYDDWVVAFEEAIRKRAYPNCFIGLSGGYDSGAIACELLRQNMDFKAYSIIGSENVNMLKRRLQLVNGELVSCSDAEYAALQLFIKEHAEEYSYKDIPYGPTNCNRMTDDCGAVGSALLYQLAQRDGLKVGLCGQGADEIISDYSHNPSVSTLNGYFPYNLKEWPNFKGGCQKAYLRKEEYIAGCYGMESRYPYLDTALVQEFLWLSQNLKNRSYKAPLDHYLTINRFPFEANAKVGFSAML